MFKPLSLFIGGRYVRSRHGNGFSSFISASSTVGIALGVMVLIVVLSAMNGFERELTKKLLSIVPHIELISVKEPINNWPASIKKFQQQAKVTAAAPVIKLGGMLQHKAQLKAVEVRAVEPKLETLVSDIDQYITQGSWQKLNSENQTSIVLGSGVAKKLQVKLGDKVQMLLPPSGNKDNLSKAFLAPKTKYAKVVGIFKFGGTIDETLAYISLKQGQQLLDYSAEQAQGVRISIDDVFAAPKTARDIAYSFDHYVYINDWTRTQGHVFNDIQLVRLVMFIVLTLVIAVASFNIVSTLIMSVNEKQGDIAILKTMGAKPITIMMSFIVQGLVNGVLGCVSGALLGIYLANNLSSIMRAIESFFGVQFLSGDVYFINYLPSVLQLSDVYITVITALVLSLVATIYPAWRATKVEPAQVLGQI